jgi:acetyl-CoA acetyltransferase
VAIGIRRHASRNPAAVFQAPLSLEEYTRSRYIARPLRLFDYCVPCDGAVCYIVTTQERARELRKRPVTIGGVVERAALRETFVPDDFWQAACQGMAQEIFQRAGIARSEISSLQVYDNFSIAVPWALEGFGFSKQGEALAWVQEGRIEIGGELPVNTSGGMLSEAYLQGWNHHAEAVRQLRGEGGPRQVTNCRSVLYACLAPICSATLLLNG